MHNIDINTVREELVQALSKEFDDSKGIAVYGAGDTAERWFAPFLEGDVVPDYYIDDTPGKAGTLLYGKPVISFEEAHSKCKSFLILLASIVPRTREIMADALRQYPIEGAEVCLEWEEYVFCKHADEILSVFDMLEDDISKATYANMILSKMGKAKLDWNYVSMEQCYFGVPEFMNYHFKEIFVDCGAYVGDTVEQFLNLKLGQMQKIIAFEPSERQFHAMEARVERLKREWALYDDQVELVCAGVGEGSYHTTLLKDHEKNTVTLGTALSGESAHGDIPVITLDNYFAEQPITFLKADIEGYEWKMLRGAERVIKRDRPKLAISSYHTPQDVYRLVLRLKSMVKEYRFVFRQHCGDVVEPVFYVVV